MSCNDNCCQGRNCTCGENMMASLVARLLLVVLVLFIFFGIYLTP
jgi:hypothetical protein